MMSISKSLEVLIQLRDSHTTTNYNEADWSDSANIEFYMI